jgi:hypothetical protein
MVHRLVNGSNAIWRDSRSHRFDALAVSRQQKAGHVRAKRRRSIRMPEACLKLREIPREAICDLASRSLSRHVLSYHKWSFYDTVVLEGCKTRIVREGSGYPWNRQIAIHRREDGKVDMKAIKAPR